MKEIKALIRPNMADEVIDAVENLPGSPGLTITEVQGWGHTRDRQDVRLTERIKIEIVVPDEEVEQTLECLINHSRTGQGHYGDGIIFITRIDEVVRIRTGQRGKEVLKHGDPGNHEKE